MSFPPTASSAAAPTRSRALLRALCLIVLGVGFLSFFVSLDRYPISYIDEPNFNWAAISYLDGDGFLYNYSSKAPHRDRIWAYHAPIFPRMQVLTFRLLGVSRFAARAPQYGAAYLALLLLCTFLMRRGLEVSALIVALAWLGDRSSQEVLYGRMEGLALLCEALGYVALVRVLERPTMARSAFCGSCLGMALDFHPVTFPFAIAAGLVIGAWTNGAARWRVLLGYVAGGTAPLALWLLSWMPDPVASLEQFLWHTRMSTRRTFWGALWKLLTEVLGNHRFWVLMLILTVVTLLVPLAIRRLARGGKGAITADPRATAWFLACLFAVTGLLCLCSPLVLPYYLVHFTVWPVLALATTLEAELYPPRWRLWTYTVAALVVLSWLPGLAWNAMRFREMVIHHRGLAPGRFARQLVAAIPRDAPVMGPPEMAILAKEAGLNFSPLPWFAEQAQVPPDAWLLLDEGEYREPQYVAPESLADRRVVLTGDGFPETAPYFNFPFVLLGPALGAGILPGPGQGTRGDGDDRHNGSARHEARPAARAMARDSDQKK